MRISRTYLTDNSASRERLRTILGRLAESDFSLQVGHGWTIGATLAHLAFWDRRLLGRLEEWAKDGPQSVRIVPTNFDQVNDGMLREWLLASPRDIVLEVAAAAEAVDGKLESLSPDLAGAIAAVSPRSLDRSLHRGDHLGDIERALEGSHPTR